MSNFNLGKKISPAKKAWKSITNKLQSRLHKLKLSKAIKNSKNLCIRAYNYIYPIITRKFYSLINRTPPPLHARRNFYHYYQYQQCHKNFSAIYVDQLFPERNHSSGISEPQSKQVVASSSSRDDGINCGSKLDEEEQQIIMRAVVQRSSLRKGKEIIMDSSSSGSRKCDIDGWRTPSMPHMSGVDRRAEEFISKFREDMEIQRQQSILDFQEMLARGA